VADIGTVFPAPKHHVIKAHRQNGGATTEQIFHSLSVDAPLGIKVRIHITPFPAVTIYVSGYLLTVHDREKRLFHFKQILFMQCTEERYKRNCQDIIDTDFFKLST